MVMHLLFAYLILVLVLTARLLASERTGASEGGWLMARLSTSALDVGSRQGENILDTPNVLGHTWIHGSG